MPTYEYLCEACSRKFEQFQSIKAEPLKTCPACQGQIRRLIGSGAGIIFKGSGFYQTDYRSASYQKKAEADKKPADSGKKSEGSESKPPAVSSGASN